MAKRIAGGFGGGMGYINETCGAVTGAFMLIGLKYGKVEVDDNAARDMKQQYSLSLNLIEALFKILESDSSTLLDA